MPIVTFCPDGCLRLTPKILEKHPLVPGTQITLFAAPQSGWIVLLPPNAPLPPQSHEQTNPVADWQYPQAVGEGGTIVIPALLRAAMGWKKCITVSFKSDLSCIYIFPKATKS